MTDAHIAPTTITVTAIIHTCGSWWTGLSRAHCPACHRTFSCDSAADRHRKGPHGPDRHCVDPATVGLVAATKPFGELWQNPGPDPVVSGIPAQWNPGPESETA